MTKGLIFDFDGVLINSTIASMQRHQEVARELGFNVPTRKIMRKHWGKVWSENFLADLASDLIWPHNAVEKFKQLYMEQYYLMKYEPIEGLNELLCEFNEDLYLSILSSRDKDSLRRRMDHVGIDTNLFFIIQGHNECDYTKPDPKVFDLILTRFAELNIEPQQLFYVGDTVNHDYQAAISHNPTIPFIAVTLGANTKRDFIKAGLDEKFILKAICQLSNLLNSI